MKPRLQKAAAATATILAFYTTHFVTYRIARQSREKFRLFLLCVCALLVWVAKHLIIFPLYFGRLCVRLCARTSAIKHVTGNHKICKCWKKRLNENNNIRRAVNARSVANNTVHALGYFTGKEFQWIHWEFEWVCHMKFSQSNGKTMFVCFCYCNDSHSYMKYLKMLISLCANTFAFMCD